LIASSNDIPGLLLPPYLSQASVDGRKKTFPSTELAFYQKRKKREKKTEKRKRTDGEQEKESSGRKDTMDSPCPAGICALLLFDETFYLCFWGGNAW